MRTHIVVESLNIGKNLILPMRYTYYRGLERVKNWVTLKLACMNLKNGGMGIVKTTRTLTVSCYKAKISSYEYKNGCYADLEHPFLQAV